MIDKNKKILIVGLGLLGGVALGNKVYSKLNGEVMKKYVYGFMALSGLWIVING